MIQEILTLMLLNENQKGEIIYGIITKSPFILGLFSE